MALSMTAKKAVLCLDYYYYYRKMLPWDLFVRKMGSAEAAEASFQELDETPLIISICAISFDPFIEDPLALMLSDEGHALARKLKEQR